MLFKSIDDLFNYEEFGSPEHPFFGLIQYDSNSKKLKNKELTYDFYVICLKKIESGDFWYGKTKYDSDKGFMYFFKPLQTLQVHDVVITEKGFTLFIHQDYLTGHPLFNEIKKYSFFDYDLHEALHLTPKEKDVMWSLYNKIEEEYYNNTDEFSKSIILSHLDSMLQYALRFYKRQFIDRKPLSGTTVTKFNNLLDEHFANGNAEIKGLPTVSAMASKLNISSKYLSDLLKHETRKTAIELIHLYVVSEAKNMLLTGELGVSEVAYQLGFDNPPYFSRLFKKVAGMTPKEYQNQN